MQLILHITVLLCLTAIMPETFVEGEKDSFTAFIDSIWPIVLGAIKSDKEHQKIMKATEAECLRDIASNKIGEPIIVEMTDLSISEVPAMKGEPPKYTDLANVHEITDCLDMVLIIPGYKTSVKRNTPKIVVKLTYYIRENRRHRTIYVFDCNEQLMNNYEDSVLKISDMGTKLGENLANIPNIQSLHIIGIDLGANIGAYASIAFNSKMGKKVNRFTALNPATLCIEANGMISKDLADFVDVYRTTDFYGDDVKNEEIGSIIFQIRDEKTKNSYKTFLDSTEQAVDVFIDPIVFEKRLYTITECEGKTFHKCDKNMDILDFGYAKKTVPPTNGNYVTVLAVKIEKE